MKFDIATVENCMGEFCAPGCKRKNAPAEPVIENVAFLNGGFKPVIDTDGARKAESMGRLGNDYWSRLRYCQLDADSLATGCQPAELNRKIAVSNQQGRSNGHLKLACEESIADRQAEFVFADGSQYTACDFGYAVIISIARRATNRKR